MHCTLNRFSSALIGTAVTSAHSVLSAQWHQFTSAVTALQCTRLQLLPIALHGWTCCMHFTAQQKKKTPPIDFHSPNLILFSFRKIGVGGNLPERKQEVFPQASWIGR